MGASAKYIFAKYKKMYYKSKLANNTEVSKRRSSKVLLIFSRGDGSFVSSSRVCPISSKGTRGDLAPPNLKLPSNIKLFKTQIMIYRFNRFVMGSSIPPATPLPPLGGAAAGIVANFDYSAGIVC